MTDFNHKTIRITGDIEAAKAAGVSRAVLVEKNWPNLYDIIL